MRIKQPASALKNNPQNNNQNLSIFCESFREICKRVWFYLFAKTYTNL